MSKDFDLVAFRDFCAGKPAGEGYSAVDPGCCALAQFGIPGVDSGALKELGIPEAVYTAAIGRTPFTFSALASRLSKLIENES